MRKVIAPIAVAVDKTAARAPAIAAPIIATAATGHATTSVKVSALTPALRPTSQWIIATIVLELTHQSPTRLKRVSMPPTPARQPISAQKPVIRIN